jgi:hypothetical protein
MRHDADITHEEHTTTPEDVAQWMIDELEKTGQLYHGRPFSNSNPGLAMISST